MSWLTGLRAASWRAPLGVIALITALGAGCGGSDGDDDDDVDLVDGGVDASVDGGPDFRFTCNVGLPCESVDDCVGGNPVSRTCFEATSAEVGLPIDPIRGLEGTTYQTTEWTGGYCTFEGTERGGGCTTDVDCGANMAGEANCGRCLVTGFEGDDAIRTCFTACAPANTNNGGCREGYRCDFALGVCLPGCTVDEECRVYREDTNGNGVVDPFNPIVNRQGDQLVYDPASQATCDPAAFICKQPGRPGALAGDPCDRNSQCGQDGECLTEIATDGEFEGGYCTRDACDIAGRTCGTGEICQRSGVGDSPMCLRRCTVGAEADDPQRKLGLEGAGDGCREGYQCKWDGRVAPSNDQGGCLPGNYNTRVTPNLGAQCGVPIEEGPAGLDDARCYSPFGAGRCAGRVFNFGTMSDPMSVARFWWSTCAIEDCRAAEIGEECAAAGGTCVDFGGAPIESLCLEPCNRAEDCGPTAMGNDSGLACNRGITGDGSGVCWWSCRDDRGRGQDEYCPAGWECNRSGFCFPAG